MSGNDEIEDAFVNGLGRQRQKEKRTKVSIDNYESDSSLDDYNHEQDAKDTDEENVLLSHTHKDDMKEAKEVVESGKEFEVRYDKDEFDSSCSDKESHSDDMFDMESDSSNGEGLDQKGSDRSDEEDESDGVNFQSKAGYYLSVEERSSGDGPHHESNNWTPKIEAFSLEEERKEGSFDEEGNYFENKKDESSQDDEWMNIKRKDIRKARQAQRVRQAKEKEKDAKLTPIEIPLNQLISSLEPAETPLEALARFSQTGTRKRSRERKLKQKRSAQGLIVTHLTGICNELINIQNIENVYDMSKEELMRLFKSKTGREYLPENSRKRKHDTVFDMTSNEILEKDDTDNLRIWEFKWSELEEVNGPYTEYEMSHWTQNYFDDNVKVRKLGDENFKPIYESELKKVHLSSDK